MKRLPNWPRLLVDFVESRRCAPFQWGVNDCGLFAADATRAITGIDPAEKIRGYRTALGAARLGRSARTESDPYGVASLPARCGFVGVPVTRAIRGDLVMFAMAKAASIGVCLGNLSAATGPDGLVYLPTLSAVAAWRF